MDDRGVLGRYRAESRGPSVLRQFSRKPLSRASSAACEAYDHDAIAPDELAWILEIHGVADGSHSLGEQQGLTPESLMPAPEPAPYEPPAAAETVPVPEVPEEPLELSAGVGFDLFAADAGDAADQSCPPSFDFDVPDLEAAERPEDESDLQPDVTDATRARQLAVQFLIEIGELDERNIDRITSIIAARRWATAQAKVRELVASRYPVEAVHLIFEVSEAWRHCEWLDQNAGGLRRFVSPLTWRDAARIVDFFGSDAEVDDIMEFVEAEHHVWRARPHLQGLYPQFKHYLLEERLAHETRRNDAGWMPNLDPHDERTFDGWINPEYSPEWWEDELSGRVAGCVAARLFIGESLADMLTWPEDSIGLLES